MSERIATTLVLALVVVGLTQSVRIGAIVATGDLDRDVDRQLRHVVRLLQTAGAAGFAAWQRRRYRLFEQLDLPEATAGDPLMWLAILGGGFAESSLLVAVGVGLVAAGLIGP